MADVIVHYWSPRLFATSKSLTGHVALQTRDVYASWAPVADQALGSITRPVGANPRPSYANDLQLAGGTHSERVSIRKLDAKAIRDAWVGLAANLADPDFMGPPIGYQLVPMVAKGNASSCATLVVKLLRAGGSDGIHPWTQRGLVTPGDVREYASMLQ